MEETAAKEVQWSNKGVRTLLDRLEGNIPADDTHTPKVTLGKLNWGDVAFDGYSEEACKEKWGSISKQLRHYRTLRDLVSDAAAEVKKSPTHTFSKTAAKNPAIPRRPLSVMFRYFKKVRPAAMEENPKLSIIEVTRDLTQRYKELSEKKRAKYQKAYDKAMKIYTQHMELWKEVYPEDTNTSKKVAPRLPTPRGIYIKQMLEGFAAESSEEYHDEALRHAEDYEEINEETKGGLEAELAKIKTSYLETYKTLHADDRPRRTDAYQLYWKEMEEELVEDIPDRKMRYEEMKRRWKLESVEKKKEMKLRAQQLNASLGPRRSPAAEVDVDDDDVIILPSDVTVTGLGLFIKAKEPNIRAAHPELTEDEITRMLQHAFAQLKPKKKRKYEDMARCETDRLKEEAKAEEVVKEQKKTKKAKPSKQVQESTISYDLKIEAPEKPPKKKKKAPNNVDPASQDLFEVKDESPLLSPKKKRKKGAEDNTPTMVQLSPEVSDWEPTDNGYSGSVKKSATKRKSSAIMETPTTSGQFTVRKVSESSTSTDED